MRRITAYGVCLDDEGRVLLARTGGGRWSVPGAVVGHGEDPRRTVADAFSALAGVRVRVGRVRDIVTDIVSCADGVRHDDQLVFDVDTDDGVTGDGVRWASPTDLDRLPLTRRGARLLGRDDGDETDQWVQAGAPYRRQRFAVYALATDPDGQVLLARISDGYPSAGRWHLPGGGTDAGESAAIALMRELYEETGQTGDIESVLDVASLHETGAMGPEGHPIDFHGVAVIYRVRVDQPTQPQVLDPGGSTIDAEWFTPYDAMDLMLTDTARAALLRALTAL